MKDDILEILEDVRDSDSFYEKIDILRIHRNNQDLKRVFNYSYSPTFNFYLNIEERKLSREVNINPRYRTKESRWFRWIELVPYINGIGEKANKIDQILSFIDMCTYQEKVWYSRIINGNLSIGVGIQGISKIWKDIIPNIYCPKYQPIDGFSTVGNNSILEPIIDGFRVIIYVRDGYAFSFYPNGRRIRILDGFLKHFDFSKNSNIVLDGYVFNNTWDHTRYSLLTGDGITKIKIYLNDFITLKEYKAKKSNALSTRLHDLDLYLNGIRCPFLIPIKRTKCDSSNAKKLYDEYLVEGRDGVVIRDLGKKYFDNNLNRVRKYFSTRYMFCTKFSSKSVEPSITVTYRGEDVSIVNGVDSTWTNRMRMDSPIGQFVEVDINNRRFIRVCDDCR